MDVILNNTNPTIEQVREWGYNEQTLLIEQDEDLILHDSKYTSILFELASDDNCPKHDYCLSILAYFSQIQLAFRQKDIVEEISRHINESAIALSDSVNKWKLKFNMISDLIKHPKELLEMQAQEIAFDLTVGEYCRREFKKLRMLNSGYIEYVSFTDSYKEYFYIDPKSCFWKISRHARIDNI